MIIKYDDTMLKVRNFENLLEGKLPYNDGKIFLMSENRKKVAEARFGNTKSNSKPNSCNFAIVFIDL